MGPGTEPIYLDSDSFINSVDQKKGYKYLGMLFYPSDDINDMILKNLNKRLVNISKFYAWLDVNDDTPIEIKLMMLDNCVFSAILYGVEAWGDISHVEGMLTNIEMKALKVILKVKKGTTNDLVLHELRRSCIIAKIKDRQYCFFKKVSQFKPSDAILSYVISLCKNTKIIQYYTKLSGNNSENDINNREERIKQSTSSMCIYYCQFNFESKSCIYSSMFNDYYRHIISRWRLSNHYLRIETGRYERPMLNRDERICEVCRVIEDEYHAIFVCPLYRDIRTDYPHLISSNNISAFFNPNYDHVRDTACFLHEIEKLRK